MPTPYTQKVWYRALVAIEVIALSLLTLYVIFLMLGKSDILTTFTFFAVGYFIIQGVRRLIIYVAVGPTSTALGTKNIPLRVAFGVILLLLVMVGWGLSVATKQSPTTDSKPASQVSMSIKYDRQACSSPTYPLAITVKNGASTTVSRISFSVAARRSGFSTDLMQFRGSGYTWDKIVAPGSTFTLCYSYALDYGNEQYNNPSALDFSVTKGYVTFQ